MLESVADTPVAYIMYSSELPFKIQSFPFYRSYKSESERLGNLPEGYKSGNMESKLQSDWFWKASTKKQFYILQLGQRKLHIPLWKSWVGIKRIRFCYGSVHIYLAPQEVFSLYSTLVLWWTFTHAESIPKGNSEGRITVKTSSLAIREEGIALVKDTLISGTSGWKQEPLVLWFFMLVLSSNSIQTFQSQQSI